MLCHTYREMSHVVENFVCEMMLDLCRLTAAEARKGTPWAIAVAGCTLVFLVLVLPRLPGWVPFPTEVVIIFLGLYALFLIVRSRAFRPSESASTSEMQPLGPEEAA